MHHRRKFFRLTDISPHISLIFFGEDDYIYISLVVFEIYNIFLLNIDCELIVEHKKPLSK